MHTQIVSGDWYCEAGWRDKIGSQYVDNQYGVLPAKTPDEPTPVFTVKLNFRVRYLQPESQKQNYCYCNIPPFVAPCFSRRIHVHGRESHVSKTTDPTCSAPRSTAAQRNAQTSPACGTSHAAHSHQGNFTPASLNSQNFSDFIASRNPHLPLIVVFSVIWST